MKIISLLVCSRISGNKNYSLFNLLESLKLMSSNYKNFEVLIKFDSDDKKVAKILPKLNNYPFKIKYLIEPRGRGYLDLHVFYNRLFSLVDERSVVVGAMGDDFVITEKGWDGIILSKTNVFSDKIFIIHGRPHPPISRENYQEQKFYLDFDINNLENLYIIDEAPFWSKKLIDICGGFGSTLSTDAWTLSLEYSLFHRCGVNRTIFLKQPIAYRIIKDEIDQKMSIRWWTDRAEFFAFMRSSFYHTFVGQQAANIYCNIKINKMSMLPPPLVQKKSDFNPTILTPNELRGLKCRVLFSKLKRTILNLSGPMRPVLKKVYRRLYPLSNNKGSQVD